MSTRGKEIRTYIKRERVTGTRERPGRAGRERNTKSMRERGFIVGRGTGPGMSMTHITRILPKKPCTGTNTRAPLGIGTPGGKYVQRP